MYCRNLGNLRRDKSECGGRLVASCHYRSREFDHSHRQPDDHPSK
jgi:hypothetical protein